MAYPVGVLAAALGLSLSCAEAISADLSRCGISVHAVDEKRKSSDEPLIHPDQVLSAELMDVDPPNQHWFVTLTAEGGQRMLAYTATNIGGELATFCDGREVARATVLQPFSRHFIVDTSAD